MLLALVYISVLCFTGTHTNEKTRYIVRDLLNTVPEHHDSAGRFYVPLPASFFLSLPDVT